MAACSKVPEIFENMDYGENAEKVDEALEWLKNKGNEFFTYIENSNEKPNGLPIKLAFNNHIFCTVYTPEIDNITKIIKSTDVGNWVKQKTISKMLILNRISKAIEKKANLIAQLELLFRGILTKDTKNKAIPLLSNYFRYYSAFADQSSEQGGIAVGVVSDENYLSYLGLFIAPALARGYSIVLHIATQLTPVAFLLKEIAESAGVPENAFKIIPSDDGELLPYLNSEKVKIISIFGDVNNEKYRGVNSFNKNILILTTYKTPTIIFDSADLDSACESVIESAWGYQGLLPWSTDTILVQENVIETFYSKLKSKLSGLKVSKSLDKSADIFPGIFSVDCLDKLVKEAKQQGIEVFHSKPFCSEWCPTVFKGGKVKTNNVLNSNCDVAKAGVLTVLTFRSIDEAVSLANNTRQGLWASVWSENIGVVNEVTKKLKVSNVWVNTNYVPLAPEVVISPIKESGFGNFGGKKGFYEYKFIDRLIEPEALVENHTATTNIESIVSAAKVAQQSWEKLPKIQKQKILLQFMELNLEWSELDAFVRAFSRVTIEEARSTTISGYHLTSTREPRGIVVLYNDKKWCAGSILTSLYEGNALILLEANVTRRGVFEKLTQLLPKGVFNVLPYSESTIKKLSANKLVSVILGFGFDRALKAPLNDSKMYRQICGENDDCGLYVSYTKNVWSDIGKSSTCNF